MSRAQRGKREIETGWDFRGARLYDADYGRFLSLDPHGGSYPGISPYMYVLGDPTSMIDPTGMDGIPFPEANLKNADIFEWKGETYEYFESSTRSGWRKLQSAVITATSLKKHETDFYTELWNFYHRNYEYTAPISRALETAGQEPGAIVYNSYGGGLITNLIMGSEGPQTQTMAGKTLECGMMFLTPTSLTNGAVKAGAKATAKEVVEEASPLLLQRFNSVESLIESAGKLEKLKGGVRQGFIQGNADDIFKGLAQNYGAKIEANGTELFFNTGNIRVGIHNSIRSFGTPTLHLNNAGQLYKIRITP